MEATHAPETHQFQAEITQLLDIVINSLYTDREIFVRELVSNAADALEKVRHELLINPDLPDRDDELAIKIDADKEKKIVTIVDNGIGMTRDELSENLGTIAHSGTRAFMQHLREASKGDDATLIGQFGVGFYSAFMVAKKVTVETKSFHPDSPGLVWESDGSGSYTIAEKDGLARGTRVIIELKDDAEQFADPSTIKDVVRRFSNFVSFPVEVDGEKVNTIQAIWARNKSDISDEEYTEFYKFIANAFDEPQMRLHFTADAPLSIKALLFVPKRNIEEMGFGRMEPGVDLYCKKVLIGKHPENLLPEWMRFVRGVIDSDDIPLNISRESMQDSLLVKKIGNVITGRFVKFLAEQARNESEKFDEFFKSFGRFIKEGIASDFGHREELAKLLRFETSKTEKGKTTSLEEYVARMQTDQKAIYYISGPSREAIEAGPYVEALRARDLECIYNYDQIDDFVFDNLGEFQEKQLKSADRGDLDLSEIEEEGEGLDKDAAEKLCGWLKEKLGDRIGSVRASKRLVTNPAAIVSEGPMTANMQRLMQAMSKDAMPPTGFTLEINPRHAFIKKLHDLQGTDQEFATQLAEQLFDNAMLGAGLLTDPRSMVERLNKLLSKAAGV